MGRVMANEKFKIEMKFGVIQIQTRLWVNKSGEIIGQSKKIETSPDGSKIDSGWVGSGSRLLWR